MTTEKLNRLWLFATGILILIIIISCTIILIRRDNGQSLSIIQPPKPQYAGQIYVDGAVNRPGSYAFGPNDSLNGLIESSGGLQNDADMAAMQLFIPSSEIPPDFQKIDINTADKWLLQALPGIGEVKAQAILDYRQSTGHFDNIEQLTSVPGITRNLYDNIKSYITTVQH
jgi:competence protein ComEA